MEITLNGKVFSRGAKALACHHSGYYRGYTHTVTIHNRKGLKVAVINRHGVLCCATRLESGRWWYSFATIDLIGKFDSYTKEAGQVHHAQKIALGLRR